MNLQVDSEVVPRERSHAGPLARSWVLDLKGCWGFSLRGFWGFSLRGFGGFRSRGFWGFSSKGLGFEVKGLGSKWTGPGSGDISRRRRAALATLSGRSRGGVCTVACAPLRLHAHVRTCTAPGRAFIRSYVECQGKKGCRHSAANHAQIILQAAGHEVVRCLVSQSKHQFGGLPGGQCSMLCWAFTLAWSASLIAGRPLQI